ncbi:hypothetical protein SAMN05216559_0139 [Halomicrobium zhouii]|uniref:Uncharacterized protein n=1 Tax=Halomicrobium zhouii TaxID=767519 RepID=A0A1I6K3S4_9EURY|nr:hypothetical protein [Halomicrobium zhouii]SFR85814.1 hypothetical protein SAMN05216559_0139 [Halomicrobium zhouii]
MACYETLYEGGDYSEASDPMYIRLYPNQYSDDGAIDPISTRMDTACQQLLSYGSVNYYSILECDWHPYASGSGKLELLRDFESYLDSNECNGIALNNLRGCHLLVTDKASEGYCRHDNAFNTSTSAIVGTDYKAKEFFSNLAIHEAFHAFMVVSDSDEHRKGAVTRDGEVTPMATSYEYEYGPEGECTNQNLFQQLYEVRPTTCTGDGIKYGRIRDEI